MSRVVQIENENETYNTACGMERFKLHHAVTFPYKTNQSNMFTSLEKMPKEDKGLKEG